MSQYQKLSAYDLLRLVNKHGIEDIQERRLGKTFPVHLLIVANILKSCLA